MAFLGVGKKKTTHLPPLGLPPAPPPPQEDIKHVELPKLPDLPPLPNIGPVKEEVQELKPILEIGKGKPIKETLKEPLPELKKELELPPLPDLPPLPEFEEPEEIKIEPKVKPGRTKPLALETLPALDKRKYEYPGLKPLFVKGSDYRSIINGVNTIKKRILEAEKIFDDLQNLKKRKEKQRNEWVSLLEDVQRKLVYVEKSIFKT